TAKTFRFPQGLKVAGMDDKRTLWMFQSEEKTFFKARWEAQVVQRATVLPPELPGFVSSMLSSSRKHLNSTGDFIWWLSTSKNVISFPIAWNTRENISYDFRDDIVPLLTYRDVPYIHNVCLDAENRLWLATEDGIFILSLKKNKFTTVIAPKGENYNVRSIIEDNNGVLYIKTYEGMLQIHPEKGVLKANSIPNGITIIKDFQGKLWFGGGTTVEQYDPVSGKKQYYGPKPGERRPEVVVLMPDAIGRIRIGTQQGLYTLNPETGRFQQFTRYNTFTELRESAIYYMQETKEGIWIGADSGLYLLEPGKGITTRYSSEEATPKYIPHNYILHFYRDTQGLFWLATRGGGLIRFDPATGNTRQFTTTDGLSNNIIYAVYEDDYGKLWLPSDYGLMQFDKNTHQVNTYLESDGIAHNEFNTNSHYRGLDGRLYFGSLAGLTSFHPRDFVNEDRVPAPLRITRCQVLNGKTGTLTDKTLVTTNTGALTLSPSDKSLLIDFALLNYKNIETNTYAYKIEGLDKDWTPIRTNSLRLNALPYGKYILHIKGQGIGGEQSANTLTLDLRVNKPFYLKNGFILSVVLALGLLIYGIFRWRLQSLKIAKIRLQEIVKQRTREIQQQKDEIENDKNTIEQQAIKLRELDSAKSRFFANISHELRTPLTLILGHLQATLREKYGKLGQQIRRNLEVSHSNSRRLLSMIEEILMLSKMEAGKLELHNKPVNLYKLIDRLCESFRPYIEAKHIRFSRHIAIGRDSIVLLDEKKFEKIVSNLLSNAIKFTEAGDSISVSAAELTAVKGEKNKETLVKFTVRDSGSGIHPKDLPRIFDRFYQGGDKDTPIEGGTGIGLALSRELAELLGGSLSAESRLGQGSVFTFAFPKRETSVLPEEKRIATTDPPMSPKVRPEKQNNTPAGVRGDQTPVILLVEDHPEMRSFIRRQIAEDYRVLEAADGVEALEVLKKHRIDLILSDVMMPRMDGFQLLSMLRSDPATETIPVIMLTARAAREDRLHALTIGVDDYLTKPFDEEELMARIRYSLRNALKRQRWSARLPEEEKEVITADKQFLTKAETVVIKALSDHQYSVMDMAEALNMSQRQLSRKIRAATGLSPLQFIREIRLQKARMLLEGKEKETVAEVMYAVGFQKSDYFARVYRKRFGRLPSTYFS
ncbi:MAG: response regulator, partial [Bacteroidota bacterium]